MEQKTNDKPGHESPPGCKIVPMTPKHLGMVFLDEIPRISKETLRKALQTLTLLLLAVITIACEKAVLPNDDGSMTLSLNTDWTTAHTGSW